MYSARLPSPAVLTATLMSMCGQALAEDQPVVPIAPDHTLVVTGERGHPYAAPESSALTRVDAPSGELPLSVQSVTRPVLEDRQALTLGQAVETVSSVQQLGGYGNLPTAGTFIRGFRSNNGEHLRDGFRDYGFITPRDLANIERVEVLKGPASLMAGAVQPGGVVNTVSKIPRPTAHYGGRVLAGSDELLRAEADVGGPLLSSGALLGRLTAAYGSAESYRDHVEEERWFVAPSATWRFGEDFRITVLVEHLDYEFTFDRGLPVVPEALDVPVGRFLGEPDAPQSTSITSNAAYRLDYRITDGWHLRQGLFVGGSDGEFYNRSGFSLQADRRTVNRVAYNTTEDSRNYSLQTELAGRFTTGPITHRATVGVELARSLFRYHFDADFTIAPIDLYDPVYTGDPTNFSPFFANDSRADTVAPYVMDLMSFGERLFVLVSCRLDLVRVRSRDLMADTVTTDEHWTEPSPQAGVLWRVAEHTGLYGSWTRSFNPLVSGATVDGTPFEPETGEQVEVGVKQGLVPGMLDATLAGFHITKRNITTADPDNPGFNIQTGEQRSRGLELDVVGEPIRGWRLILAGAYLDAEVTEDNRLPVGDALIGVPEWSGSLWNTYELQDGVLRGLGLGLGLYYVGEREAALPNTFNLPDYLRVDASLFYRQPFWTARIGVENLTDETYHDSVFTAVMPQAPLTVVGSLSAEF
jgi:iron complex outermembrane recepter protein